MVAVNYIYGLFGHGVRSAAMTWMFLYPLLGGTLLFGLLDPFLPQPRRVSCYRLCFNLYNSGIAALTAAAFLQGIVEIAGTGTPFTAIMYGAGWTLVASAAALLLIRGLPQVRRERRNRV